MSTTNLTYNDFANNGYLSNVAAAARQLMAAVFAVKASPAVVADEVDAQLSKEASISWLNSLANDCDRHSPNLSAELRFLASRG
jgi:hypothetical protein